MSSLQVTATNISDTFIGESKARHLLAHQGLLLFEELLNLFRCCWIK